MLNTIYITPHRGFDGLNREGGHTGREPCGGSGSMKGGDASSRKETRKDTENTDTIPQSRSTVAETPAIT